MEELYPEVIPSLQGRSVLGVYPDGWIKKHWSIICNYAGKMQNEILLRQISTSWSYGKTHRIC